MTELIQCPAQGVSRETTDPAFGMFHVKHFRGVHPDTYDFRL